MLTMAKKKSETDRHKSMKVIRLGDDVHEALSRMADHNDRPITREARRIVIAALEEAGFWPAEKDEE